MLTSFVLSTGTGPNGTIMVIFSTGAILSDAFLPVTAKYTPRRE